MSTLLRKPMTMAEFLPWEQRQPTKHEFDGFHVVAMAGGTVRHADLQRNLAISVGGALRGKRCRFYGSDLQVRLESSVRYPDGTVVCNPLPGEAVSTSEPVVLFEVLSPSTEGTDRIAKTREYQAIASLQRYVMLEQDQVAATVFARTADRWSVEVLAAGETLAMPEIGISVALDELYLGVDLPRGPTPQLPREHDHGRAADRGVVAGEA